MVFCVGKFSTKLQTLFNGTKTVHPGRTEVLLAHGFSRWILFRRKNKKSKSARTGTVFHDGLAQQTMKMTRTKVQSAKCTELNVSESFWQVGQEAGCCRVPWRLNLQTWHDFVQRALRVVRMSPHISLFPLLSSCFRKQRNVKNLQFLQLLQ